MIPNAACMLYVSDMYCGLTPDEKAGQRTPLCKTPESEMLQFAAQLLPGSLSAPIPVRQAYSSVSPPFDPTQMIPLSPPLVGPICTSPPVGYFAAVHRGTTYFMAGQEVTGGLYGTEIGAWHPITQPDLTSQAPGTSQTSVGQPTILQTANSSIAEQLNLPQGVMRQSIGQGQCGEQGQCVGQDQPGREGQMEGAIIGENVNMSPSLQEAGAQLRQMLQDKIRTPSGSPRLVIPAGNHAAVPSMGSPSLCSPQVRSYESSAHTSRSVSPADYSDMRSDRSETPPVRECPEDIAHIIAETEQMILMSSLTTPESTAPNINVKPPTSNRTSRKPESGLTPGGTLQCLTPGGTIECLTPGGTVECLTPGDTFTTLSPGGTCIVVTPGLTSSTTAECVIPGGTVSDSRSERHSASMVPTVCPLIPVCISPWQVSVSEDECSSPLRSQSESSMSPIGSPQRGTPKRSRIAARFNMPVSPAKSDASGT